MRGHRDVRVTVIGDSNRTESGERKKQRILKAVDEHGLREKIRFLGYQPYEVLMREAHQHHVFLSPSVTAEASVLSGAGWGKGLCKEPL